VADAVDLACFSYLSSARLLTVDRYPQADTGTEVHGVYQSLAGDGPITALTATALGLRCSLAANQVGPDATGTLLLDQLDTAGIHHRLDQRTAAATPEITVITDQRGTRTWFAHLAHATTELRQANLTPLTAAQAAYIDCYEVITPAAARAITMAAQAGVPVILNLGADLLHPDVHCAALAAEVIAVQTSLPDHQAALAEQAADALFQQLHPRAVLVTLGRRGAVARTATGRYHAPAGNGSIAHTHGAGAAFSGGFAASYLRGHDIPTALHHACQTGTAHCTQTSHPRSLQGAEI
jgi:sugar/nucleoside kinase (ribokinase family)